MSNKDYYARWLELKYKMEQALTDDALLQHLATVPIGVKPQSTAVEIVSRVYSKYCIIYNQLCDCYDQMHQIQRRPFIRKLIDTLTCRILELKDTLERVEAFEYTYPENALRQLLITPQDIQILCPFFYPFETRQEELQYIVDEILAGNRLGDPTPTPSEIERKEEERLEAERIKQEQKEAEIKMKLAMGYDISLSAESVPLTPEEQEALRKKLEYEEHVNNIQRMERAKIITRKRINKINKDRDMYLELAGLKAPQASDELKLRAATLIELVFRAFMEVKRKRILDNKLKQKLGMIITGYKPPSQKFQLENVREVRRNFRRKYEEKWLKENLKEHSRVFRLREGQIMEDISDEMRQWFAEWFEDVRTFDEYPWPDEGGSILIVRGETFSIPEYIEWKIAEEKRLKAEASAPKSKEQIKAEKIAAKEERKRLAAEAKEREKKMLSDYKKMRLNPSVDPGIYLKIGNQNSPLQLAWESYQNQWKHIDVPDAPLEVFKGFLIEIMTENAYQDAQLKLRPIVDEMMRLELAALKAAAKKDYAEIGIEPPLVKKRKKPKPPKKPKVDKSKPAVLFQSLVDLGIVRKYPRVTLDDFLGDQNFAAADMRAIPWLPVFPPPCMGDVREQVRIRCLLTMGCSCPNAVRSHLFVGPRGSGKKTLAYAIATETNSILIDLSPMNIYDKLQSGKLLKKALQTVMKVSKMLQPTVILVNNADKMFYKKVPKEEKIFDPTKLQKDFFKEIYKAISYKDSILVLGTAEEPWNAKGPAMYKAFPNQILIPRTDYASISFILTKMLMEYHGVDREFNVHSVAQAIRGYDINTIVSAVKKVLNAERVAQLYYKPLQEMEIVNAVLQYEGGVFTDEFDYGLYKQWYQGYSIWGERAAEYFFMLETQYAFKLKEEKKKPGG